MRERRESKREKDVLCEVERKREVERKMYKGKERKREHGRKMYTYTHSDGWV